MRRDFLSQNAAHSLSFNYQPARSNSGHNLKYHVRTYNKPSDQPERILRRRSGNEKVNPEFCKRSGRQYFFKNSFTTKKTKQIMEFNKNTAIVESTHDAEGMPFKVYFEATPEGEPICAYSYPGTTPTFPEDQESPEFFITRDKEGKRVYVYRNVKEIAAAIKQFGSVVTNDNPYPSENVNMFETQYFGGYD